MIKNNFCLSTKADWSVHWKKHDLALFVSESFSFHDVLKKIAGNIGESRSAIELGGFPGYFSIYLKKYCGLNVTLLDYFINHEKIELLCKKNYLDKDKDITVIEADLFEYKPNKMYDLVCSFGLVEHFTDLTEVIKHHKKFMKPGAVLFVTIPNFLGVNGMLQKIFDPENLAIHNLDIMNLSLIKATLDDLGLKDIKVEYYPSTQVWLEGLKERSLSLRITVRLVNEFTNIFGKLFGRQNWIVSNSIIITAKNYI